MRGMGGQGIIQRTEREVINNEIAVMLKEGKPYKEIAAELGVGVTKISELAKKMGLGRQLNIAPSELRQIPIGNTLEDIRKANPFKVGDKVIVKDKNGSDTYKNYKCVVEKTTDWIIFARGENGRMYAVLFSDIGIKDLDSIRKVG